MNEDDDPFDIYGFPKQKKEVPESLAEEWRKEGKCPHCGKPGRFSHLVFYCDKCEKPF